MKQKEPQFKIGDVVCVVAPTMVLNCKLNEDTNKLDVEEDLLIGDEGMVIANVEFAKKAKEYLYYVLTQNTLEGKMYALSEEQIALF